MAPVKETISCDLDRPRELRLTFRELAAINKALPAENPLRLLDALLSRTVTTDGAVQVQCGNLWALQVLLWAASQWEDGDLTLDQAADLITTYVGSGKGNLADLASLVFAAWFVGGLRPASDDEKNAVAEAVSLTQH